MSLAVDTASENSSQSSGTPTLDSVGSSQSGWGDFFGSLTSVLGNVTTAVSDAKTIFDNSQKASPADVNGAISNQAQSTKAKGNSIMPPNQWLMLAGVGLVILLLLLLGHRR